MVPTLTESTWYLLRCETTKTRWDVNNIVFVYRKKSLQHSIMSHCFNIPSWSLHENQSKEICFLCRGVIEIRTVFQCVNSENKTVIAIYA